MKKRVLAVLLSAVMALSLGACGDAQVKEPTITKLADYKNVSEIIKKAEEKNITTYFDQLMNAAGIGFVEVKDRDVVQAGDIVATDYTGYVNDVAFVGGSTIEDGKSNPQYIDVSNNCGINISSGSVTSNFIDKFTDGLIGAKKNEDKSGKVTFPDGYGSTTLVDDDDDDTNNKKVTLDNQEVTFVFNVKSIYVKTTPETLTDAMVVEKFKEVYGFTTVAELVDYIKEDATKQTFENYFANIAYAAGASVVKVTDRDAIQDGDLVKIDYTGYYDGVAFKSGTATDQYVDVKNNCIIDLSTGEVVKTLDAGFSDVLKGAKVGSEVSADITLSDNYGTTTLIDGDNDTANDVKVDLSGKKVTFKYTIKEIQIEVTPESVTDAIVKEYFEPDYGVSTTEDFLKAVKGELGFNYVVSNVIENSTFDISDDYMNKRVDQYQKVFEDLYCDKDTDLNTVLQYFQTTLEAARKEWATTLESQIKSELVFAALVEAEKLTVDEAELDEYVKNVQKDANTEGGNEYLKEVENIYKMMGAGNAETGKVYWMNQGAVRDYLMKICADAQ